MPRRQALGGRGSLVPFAAGTGGRSIIRRLVELARLRNGFANASKASLAAGVAGIGALAVLLGLVGLVLRSVSGFEAAAPGLLIGAAFAAAVAGAGLLVLVLWLERDQLVLLRQQQARHEQQEARHEQEEARHEQEEARHQQSLELWRRGSTEILGELIDLRAELSEMAREAAVRSDALYTQLEALSHLETLLGDEPPLPRLRGWALSPDAALHLVQTVFDRGPSTMVVELGSGTSTVLLGRAVRKLGTGHVTALEHDEDFAARTRQLVSTHGLTEWVDVVTAPLVEHRIAGSTYRWYDKGALGEIPDSIDVLLVDGPPTISGPLARFPAMPLLRASLADDAVVLLDDTARSEEQEIVERWRALYPDATVRALDHEKGTVEFRFGMRV